MLTGIVTALLASRRSAFESAALAAWWHGASADRLDAADLGFGLLASEVADGLPECAASLIHNAEQHNAQEQHAQEHNNQEHNAEEEVPNAGLVLRFPGP